MKARNASEPYTMTVHMTEGRKSRHKAHTVKAARHMAKALCGSANVVRITLAGPDGASELYSAA